MPSPQPRSPSRLQRLEASLSDPRRAILAAALAAIFAVCIDALSDPDVWWHIRLGRWILDNHSIPTGELFSYTAQGDPFTAHEWLTDSVFALLDGWGGLLLVAIVAALVSWSGLLAIALLLRRRGLSAVPVALTVVLVAKAAQPVLGTRPQVVTFALCAWTLLLVDGVLRDGGRRTWLLPPLVLLWANLHAGFITGLAVMAAACAAEGVTRVLHREAAPVANVRRLAMATAGAAALACLNPAGPALYRFAVVVSATERSKPIVEWQPPNFADAGLWGLLVVIVITVGLGALTRPRLRDAGFALAGMGLALIAVRNTAVGLALMAPVTGAGVAAGVARLPLRPVRPRPGRGPAVMGGLVVLLGVASAGTAIARTAADASASGIAAAYPECAARILAGAPGSQRAYVRYGSAGFVIDRDYGHVRVYEYGESISLGQRVFDDFITIGAGGPRAIALLDSSGTTAVLTDSTALAATLRSTPGWTYITHDVNVDLFARGDAAWASRTRC
jgi:hypothetical protein